MTTEIITAVPLSIAGAYLYRRGGTSAGTLWRDLGLPCCMLAYFLITAHFHWILILCFGMMYGAQTTYNKWAQRLIGVRTDDVMWVGWLVTGLAYSFAMFPYALVTWANPAELGGQGFGFLIRTLVVTGFTVAWSELVGVDVWEERGRGWIQIITLPLLIGG